VGFALDLERLHIALTGEERAWNDLTIAVRRGALFAGTLDALDRLG